MLHKKNKVLAEVGELSILCYHQCIDQSTNNLVDGKVRYFVRILLQFKYEFHVNKD